MNKGGLGRGLNSLIPNKISNQPEESAVVEEPIIIDNVKERIVRVPLDRISANPLQPREHFDHGDMEDLVNSIKKHGILQPLIVTPIGNDYQLIAGERRFKAAQILELNDVPCLVRNVEEMEKLELALIENIQRSNLNPLEEARAYQKLISEFNITQEEVGLRVGKSRATIANTLRLLDLPQEIQQALSDGRISVGHAKVILSAGTEKERLNLFEKIIKADLTVRGAESQVKKVSVKSHDRVLTKDLEVKEKEDTLRQALNTKVSINKKGDGGTVTINFYSTEELNEIIRKITE